MRVFVCEFWGLIIYVCVCVRVFVCKCLDLIVCVRVSL